jgi:hypothetical protein
MTFKFSNVSLNKLSEVHPDLQKVVKRALELSTTDFTVVVGKRTIAEQQALVQAKKSQTMQSKHLVQSDGYSHAVDLAPYPVTWEVNAFMPIALAMQKAATELGIDIRWGGAWCKLNGDKRSPSRMIDEYSKARRSAGNKVFIDAPHFELI